MKRILSLFLISLLFISIIPIGQSFDIGEQLSGKEKVKAIWVKDYGTSPTAGWIAFGTDKDVYVRWNDSGSNLTFVGTPTNGLYFDVQDIEFYSDDTSNDTMTIGLPVNTTSTITLSGATTIASSVTVPVTDLNASTYTVLATDYLIASRYSEHGTQTITIPTAQCIQGRVLIISDAYGGAGSHTLTIATESSITIAGEATATITADHGSVTLIANTQPSTNDWLVV